jgi:hypothetical protein
MTYDRPAAVKHGDCLKQSLSFLLDIELENIPNFHRFQVSVWKAAFFSWVESLGKEITETPDMPNNKCVAIYRTYDTETQEVSFLHAVVCDDGNIIFDILEKDDRFKYIRFVKAFIIS